MIDRSRRPGISIIQTRTLQASDQVPIQNYTSAFRSLTFGPITLSEQGQMKSAVPPKAVEVSCPFYHILCQLGV